MGFHGEWALLPFTEDVRKIKIDLRGVAFTLKTRSDDVSLSFLHFENQQVYLNYDYGR